MSHRYYSHVLKSVNLLQECVLWRVISTVTVYCNICSVVCRRKKEIRKGSICHPSCRRAGNIYSTVFCFALDLTGRVFSLIKKSLFFSFVVFRFFFFCISFFSTVSYTVGITSPTALHYYTTPAAVHLLSTWPHLRYTSLHYATSALTAIHYVHDTRYSKPHDASFAGFLSRFPVFCVVSVWFLVGGVAFFCGLC